MKYCDKCKVDVAISGTYCPLCQNQLTRVNSFEDGIFPVFPANQHKKNFILKVPAFICIIASIISVFCNIVTSTDVWWSMVVVTLCACAYVSIVLGIYKHKKILKYLLYQSIIITLGAIVLDFIMGWYGWSITFVVPIIFTLSMVVMFVLSKLLKLYTGDYIIYLLLDALFGIIPIIFIGSEMVQTKLPSMICIISSIVSVSALIVFEGAQMYNELKRRLHL